MVRVSVVAEDSIFGLNNGCIITIKRELHKDTQVTVSNTSSAVISSSMYSANTPDNEIIKGVVGTAQGISIVSKMRNVYLNSKGKATVCINCQPNNHPGLTATLLSFANYFSKEYIVSFEDIEKVRANCKDMYRIVYNHIPPAEA